MYHKKSAQQHTSLGTPQCRGNALVNESEMVVQFKLWNTVGVLERQIIIELIPIFTLIPVVPIY
jgi:hypothetical protein